MTSLFQIGSFVFASGQTGKVKVECDFLTRNDWEAIALIISEDVRFGSVEGVPRGGIPLADALQKYVTTNHSRHLVVDDVFTTGGSLKKVMDAAKMGINDNTSRILRGIMGYVVFQRGGTLPSNVRTVWRYGSRIIP